MPRYAQCWTLQRASGPELEKLIRAAHALVDLGFHSLAVAELVALHLQHEECSVAQTVAPTPRTEKGGVQGSLGHFESFEGG